LFESAYASPPEIQFSCGSSQCQKLNSKHTRSRGEFLSRRIIEDLDSSATRHNCKMRMGNIIGSSNFRGAANAAAMSEECARTMPRTAIVAFCTMMRTSYWKLASWNSASTPRRDRRCAAFPRACRRGGRLVRKWHRMRSAERIEQRLSLEAKRKTSARVEYFAS
jgi:hypothetical protein